MTSSVEWLNNTPRVDLAILAFVRSTNEQARKKQIFYACSVVLSYYKYKQFTNAQIHCIITLIILEFI